MIESQSIHRQAYQRALDFLYGRIDYERMASGTARYPFRLQRTDQLLQELGLGGYLHSQTDRPKVPIVHISGTKGKGSTAAMVAAALTGTGMRTGLYTSPHLHHLEERFQIDGQPCGSEELVSLVNRLEPVTERIAREVNRPLSFFELTTAIALLHFDACDCQAIVLEVGLGGRLDSTNVCAPSVTAITSIGLDHQHVLGGSLAEIAGEKAGIIKPHVPVVSGVEGEPTEVIRSRAAETSAPLFQLGSDFTFRYQPNPDWGSIVEYSASSPPLTRKLSQPLAMEGEHQAKNVAVAISIIDLLRDQGMEVDYDPAIEGISAMQCAARLERFELPNNITAIVDSAHNADSVDALCECLKLRSAGKPIALVFGTSRDKDAGSMLCKLTGPTEHLVLTRFKGNPRYSPPERLRETISPSPRASIQVIEDPIEACEAALGRLERGGMLVVCGSFFLAAETRQWFAARALPQ